MTDELFRADAYLRDCTATVTAVADNAVMTDRTVFYPTGGGQPGDSGDLILADGTTVAIVDTRKGAQPGEILHLLAPGSAVPAIGQAVTLRIDWARRHRLMRMHSALHLLSALVPYPVTGGQVSDGKGRLDFDIDGPVPDKDELTARINELITADHAVTPRWITDDELDANPDLVKTMSVRPPSGAGRVRLIQIGGEKPLDLQACGGTHVARTGEIGVLVVRKIENKGKQNRRFNLEFAG